MRGGPWWLPALTLGLLLLAPVGVGAASAASASVPCTTVALVSAINTANAAGGGTTLTLASGCTYTLTVPNTDCRWAAADHREHHDRRQWRRDHPKFGPRDA